jgi:serine/threonine-protein kinase
MDIGGVALVTGRYLAAARIFARIFEENPMAARDLEMGFGCFAARAAALAGTREGKDTAALDDPARAAWRRRAIEWLRADLDALRASGRVAAAREILRVAKADPDLAGIRDAAELEGLTSDEREACLAVWRDAGALLEELDARR